MKKLLCMTIIAVFLLQSMNVFAYDVAPYKWSNVPIGGNGFVTGVITHPTEKDLVYIRTDVGGAYRWNESDQTWTQMCTSFGYSEKNFYGIDGLAIDPQNSNVVYMAAGKWTWDTPNDVLKSTDKGKTWQRTNLNKKFEANGTYRGFGECIGVDPVNSSIIFCGTAVDGLYKSANGAATWDKISSITTLADKTQQVRVVAFDKGSAIGEITQKIYAGVTNKGIYRTLDGGATWSLIDGSPLTARRIEVGASGAVYVASTTGFYKFYNETWTQIASGNCGGVTIDPNNENRMMYIGYSSNTMKLPLYYTDDGGSTWVNKWTTAQYTSMLPWYQANGDFSSNTTDIKFDPHNSGRVWITDFLGVYKTDNISAMPNQSWRNYVKGIEEVVPAGAISQPTGKYRVISAVADVDGFPHEDINSYPTRMIRKKRLAPYMMSSTAIDFCEEDPNIVVRVGVDYYRNGKMEISTDNTETWTDIKTIPYYYNTAGVKRDQAIPFGRVAVSAQKNPATGKPSIVIIPAYSPNSTYLLPPGTTTAPLVSFDLGQTWEYVEGIPAEHNIIVAGYQDTRSPIASDRVNGNKFYIFTYDKTQLKNFVYVSEDWGKTWKQTSTVPTTGIVSYNKVLTAPYMANEVWTYNGADLYRSSNGGVSFSKINSINSCVTFGFGKNAPGRTNPTVFLYGSVENTMGIYRSLDMGATWERINDEYSKIGNYPKFMVGDRQQFGVVYMGTDGTGLFSGVPQDKRSDFSQFEQSFDGTLNDDWELSNMSVSTKSGNTTLGRVPNVTDGTAMYKKEMFSGNYKLSAKIQFYPNSSDSNTQILFNYSDRFNYYYLEITGSKVRLKKMINGISTAISEADYSVNSRLVNFEILYETGGLISAQATIANGSKTNIFSRIKDTSLTKGNVGIYTTDANMRVYSIKVDNGKIANFEMQLKNGTATVTSLASVQNQTINVDLSLRSNSMNDINCNIIACINDESGALKSVKSVPAIINSTVSNITIPISVPEDATNNFKVKCYFWDSFDNIIPIVKSITYQ